MTDIKVSDVLFLMKERYSTDISEVMNREPLLLQKITRATDVEWDGTGKYFKRPVHLEGGMSQGFYAEGESLPPSEPQVGDNYIIYCKAMAFTVRITRQNLLSLKQGMGAFVNSKAWEVNQNTMSLREKMSIAFGNEGMGVIGVLQVNAPAAVGGNTTLTMTDDTNMQYFRKGQRLDLWAPAYPVANRRNATDGDTANYNKGWKVLEVNRAARTVKIEGDHVGAGGDPALAGDYVLYQNEGLGLSGAAAGSNLESGKQIMGLLGLYNTGSKWSKLQGLSYATYPELQSPKDTAGGPRTLTPMILEKMKDDIEVAAKAQVDFIYLDHFQHRSLLAGGLQDVRHASAQINLGWVEFDWNGRKFFVDRLARPGACFLGSLSSIGRAVLAEMGPMDSSPGGERIPGYAVQEWAFGADMNLFTRNSLAGGWIENLTKV